MRRVLTPVSFVLEMAALAGCATSPAVPLSSLGHEVEVRPLRGQSVELLKQDDAACESWTRSTKAASPAPDLAGVVADLQACGLKRGLYDPAGVVFLGAVEAGMTEARRAEAWACLKQHGYAVEYQPDPRAESIRKK